MDEQVRTQRLSVALKVISIFFMSFVVFAILVIIDSPLVSEGSVIAALGRWHPFNKAYEIMIATVYIVWGIMLWRASKNPSDHKSLIEFTIWGNLAHAAVMLALALLLEGELIHAIGDVLILGLVGGVLLWLRPRGASAEPQPPSLESA